MNWFSIRFATVVPRRLARRLSCWGRAGRGRGATSLEYLWSRDVLGFEYREALVGIGCDSTGGGERAGEKTGDTEFRAPTPTLLRRSLRGGRTGTDCGML